MFDFADLSARHAITEDVVGVVADTLRRIYEDQFRGNASETYERFVVRLTDAYDLYFDTLDTGARQAGMEMARQRYDYLEAQDRDAEPWDETACPISGIDIAYCHCGRHE